MTWVARLGRKLSPLHSAIEFLSNLAPLRADFVAVLALTLAGCVICHVYIRREAARPYLSRITYPGVFAVALSGAHLAERAARLIDYPASATAGTLVLTRAMVLGSVLILNGFILV